MGFFSHKDIWSFRVCLAVCLFPSHFLGVPGICTQITHFLCCYKHIIHPGKLTAWTWKITLGKGIQLGKNNPSNIRGSPFQHRIAISLPCISSGSPRQNSKSILDPLAAAHGGRMVARINREYRGPHQLEINLGSDLGKWKNHGRNMEKLET